MKFKKSTIHILLVELVGVITFLSVALVIIVYLFTGVYKLVNDTRNLAVSSRVIQNIAEYCKGSDSRQEYESILDRLGSRVTMSQEMEWEIGYDREGEITKTDHALYLISVIMESEEVQNGEWITVTLSVQNKSHAQTCSSIIQKLSINKYYMKRG